MSLSEFQVSKIAAEAIMAAGVSEIEFTKDDGSTRTMIATRSPNHIQEKFGAIEESTASTALRVTVLDMEIGEWRSFRPERLKLVNGEDFQAIVKSIHKNFN